MTLTRASVVSAALALALLSTAHSTRARAELRTVEGTTRTAGGTEVGYRPFGLGVMVGDPTGLTAKLWVGPRNAIDFGLGFWGYGVDGCAGRGGPCDRFGYHGGTFNADYLWQSNIVRGGNAQLDWHIGPGARAIWWNGCAGDCVALAARMPVGMDLMFANPARLELFLELAPALYFVPTFADVGIEGGFGARYYF